MKYKIIELNEQEIGEFKGKIIQVLNSKQRDVVVGRNYLGCSITSFMWVLTCLVEVEK